MVILVWIELLFDQNPLTVEIETLDAYRNFVVLHVAYCVVAKDTMSKQISIAFLERMKADFRKRYRGGKADTAIPKSLNKEFG